MAKIDSRPLPDFTPEQAARFWDKVEKNGPIVRPELGPCWIWIAATTKAGYGAFTHSHGNVFLSHRIAYKLAKGVDAYPQIVMHRCDNPPCCREEHLKAGTLADNIHDMYSKHRQGAVGARPGERNSFSKLTENAVLEIRRSMADPDIHRPTIAQELADKYGVLIGNIYRVCRKSKSGGWLWL